MTQTPLIHDDVSRCINRECLMRHQCARHQQLKRERGGYISIAKFGNTDNTPTKECDFFIPIPK